MAEALSLTEDQVEEFREAFALFDQNGDGAINAEELSVVLKTLGRRATMEEIKAMIAEGDDDGSGCIEFSEFLKLMASRLYETDSVEEMREAFLVFDRDKSGCITASELKHVMNSLGEDVTTEEVEEMIREADADGDGELSFEEGVRHPPAGAGRCHPRLLGVARHPAGANFSPLASQVLSCRTSCSSSRSAGSRPPGEGSAHRAERARGLDPTCGHAPAAGGMRPVR